MSENQLAVFLPGNRMAFEPDQRLDISVLWALDRAPAVLEVRLFWVTRGKGTEDLQLVATVPIPGAAAAGEHKCAMVLPAAPWSFSGKLISLVWAVEVVAKAPDQTALCEFVMAPGAQEIRLHDAAGTRRPAGS